MMIRIAIVAAVLALGAFALWHPAARPPVAAVVPSPVTQPSLLPRSGPRRRLRDDRSGQSSDAPVVYVVGAVKRPGLYRVHDGDRVAKAVALAGGLRASADAAGVNLAARAGDGDEIYVPALGESPQTHASAHRSRRRAATPPPAGAVDVNRAGAKELAAVPGIGHALAGRIVELRDREGSFASLDELLDVAGMTQERLERARPYLMNP